MDLSEPRTAYKLFRLMNHGGLRSLFIDRRHDLPLGVWMRAEPHRTKGFAFRPGWHACPQPLAPHLSPRGRVWCEVEVDDFEVIARPASQGGDWMLAKWLRILRALDAPALPRE